MSFPSWLKNSACAMLPIAFAVNAWAANECRVTILHFAGDPARSARQTTTAVLDAGDVTAPGIDWLESIRNDGTHDVRATFLGMPTRVLMRGQIDPSQGRYASRVKLTRLECLPTRNLNRTF
jgi:hypothetical protein